MKTLAVASLLAANASAAGTAWDYKDNGAKWAELTGYKTCADAGGSPIDLKTNLSLYKKHDVKIHRVNVTFTNLKKTKV